MLRIWGRISSINVRKVVLAAQWVGVPFERIDAGARFGVVDTPDFKSKNPNAMIPLIEDGDVVLWESNVIVRYLCAQYGDGSLYPAPLGQRFDAERWMDWQQTTLNPASRDAFVQLIRVPAAERVPARIDASVTQTEALLDMLEAHLAAHTFMVGESFTMADIPIACEMHRWRGLPLEHRARPAQDRWYASILAHPAARGVLDIPLS